MALLSKTKPIGIKYIIRNHDGMFNDASTILDNKSKAEEESL